MRRRQPLPSADTSLTAFSGNVQVSNEETEVANGVTPRTAAASSDLRKGQTLKEAATDSDAEGAEKSRGGDQPAMTDDAHNGEDADGTHGGSDGGEGSGAGGGGSGDQADKGKDDEQPRRKGNGNGNNGNGGGNGGGDTGLPRFCDSLGSGDRREGRNG